MKFEVTFTYTHPYEVDLSNCETGKWEDLLEQEREAFRDKQNVLNHIRTCELNPVVTVEKIE